MLGDFCVIFNMKQLWLILFVIPLFAQEYGVLTINGDDFTGELISLDKNGIKLKNKYGSIDIPSSDIMIIYYPTYLSEIDSIWGDFNKMINSFTKDIKNMSKNDIKSVDDVSNNKSNDSLPTPRVKFIPIDDFAVPLKPIRPKYPKVAKEAGIEGTVVVQVYVNEKGRVTETVILKGIPDSGLDEAAIKAIENVKFRPAKAGNKKVGSWVSIPVNFRLPRGKFW